MATRSFRIENLELRQLMAGDGVDCTIDGLSVLESTNTLTGATTVTGGATLTAVQANASLSLLPAYWASAPTLVERAGATVVLVTDVAPGKQILWGIREGGDAGATIAFQIDLGDLRAQQLLVDGDRLLVIGETGLVYPMPDQVAPIAIVGSIAIGLHDRFAPYQDKKILAISLTSGEVVKELSLSPGYVKHARFVAGKALLVVDSYNLNDPSLSLPVDPIRELDSNDEVYRFSWDAAGVSDVTTDVIPSGQVAVAGDRLVVASIDYSTTANLPGALPSVELSSFTITADDLVSNGSLDLGTGYGSYLHLDSSGDRATLVRQQDFRNEPVSRQLLLIDLTTAAPSIDETIDFGAQSQVLSQEDDYLLLQDYASGTVSVIDLGNDVAGIERVTKIELPEGLSVFPDAIRLDEERLLLFAGPALRPMPLSIESLPVHNASRATLLTLSLVDGAIKTQELSDVSYHSSLRLIDSTNGRFGFETFSYAANGTPTRAFVYGKLNGDGRFVAEGEVEVKAWSESIDADASKLIVASASRVTEYDYDDPTEPLYSLRLVDPDASPLEAIDDTADFYYIGNAKTSLDGSWDNIISVLANDQIPFGSRPETRITELIDAPVGVRIVDGQYLALSADEFTEAGKFVFKYRVTDGFSESEAEVELTIKAITDELRVKMIAAVKTQAATDLGIPVEQISVEFDVEFPFDRVPYPLPGVVTVDGAKVPVAILSQSPRFFARVTTPRVNAVYSVDVNGSAFKAWSQQVQAEPLVSLTFAVKDAAGKQVEKVEVGQTFWLEFRGDDLRSFGQGVFSAYLNLELANSVVAGESSAVAFDGTVEPGPGMTLIDASNAAEKIKPTSIRNLGVVSSGTDAPGGEPQLLLRVRVKAERVGGVTFNSFASQNAAEEIVVFGSTAPVAENQTRRGTASLRIVEPVDASDPSDVDGDGKVLAIDALRVINFLARHGTGTIEQIEARMRTAANSASTPTATTEIFRFDVNRNGSITALDALSVINQMSRMNRQRAASGEGMALSAEDPQSIVANGMITSATAIDELEQKRRVNLKR